MHLVAACWVAGGECVIENPPDYAEEGVPWTQFNSRHNPEHCPLWEMPWVKAFEGASKSIGVHFAQCTKQSPYQKYTRLLCTPGVYGEVSDFFEDYYCTCKRPHDETARGVDMRTGAYRSAAAAAYPRLMNLQLAESFFKFASSTEPSMDPITGQPKGPRKKFDVSDRKERLRHYWPMLASVEAKDAVNPQRAGCSRLGGQLQGTLAGFILGPAGSSARTGNSGAVNDGGGSARARPRSVAVPTVELGKRKERDCANTGN